MKTTARRRRIRAASTCRTAFDLRVQEHNVVFTIEPGQGDVSVVPQQRTYRLIFHRVTQPAEMTVTVDGMPRDVMTLYDENCSASRWK